MLAGGLTQEDEDDVLQELDRIVQVYTDTRISQLSIVSLVMKHSKNHIPFFLHMIPKVVMKAF